ncbi:MAG: biopolymer transporter ExbD [Chitinophagales bacterium]|nr:biopolymer transporter ExbD [Chitinophagales bacterium]
MAEISQGGGGDKGGKVRSKKQSTRIDMTPMVDLAFLLLTFFVLTTSLNKPQTMEIRIPDKDDPKNQQKPIEINEERAITLLLSGENKLYWYPKINPETLQETDYGVDGIRKILEENEAKINAKFGGKEQSMFVFIKPMDDSNYKNMVDILDEMKVVDIKKYALMEPTGQDKNIINQYASSMGATTPTE